MTRAPVGSWATPWASSHSIRRPVRSTVLGFDGLVVEVKRRARRSAPKGECTVRLGRVIRLHGVVEQAVYVERSPTAGAYALIRWRPDEVTLEIGPSSRRQRAVQWAALAVGLGSGFGVTGLLAPWSQPRLAWLCTLFIGVVLGALLTRIVSRKSIAMDGPASRELAERLADRLRGV